MTTEKIKYVSQADEVAVNAGERASCCGLATAEKNELVDCNALPPIKTSATESIFSSQWVAPLRAVIQLRVDFDLDMFAVATVLGQLDLIVKLKRQASSMQALLVPHARCICHG